MTVSTLEHFRQHIRGMTLPLGTMLLLTCVVSVVTVILTIMLALVIGYPIPFGLIVGTLPWFFTLMAGLLFVKWDQYRRSRHLLRNTLRYLIVCGCQIAITMIYPLYNYAFVRLAPTHQTAFVLLLPVIKIVAKNWISYAILDWDDGKPEAVVFNIDIFHALYVAFCMQSATSIRTVFVLMIVDFVQSWLSYHDIEDLLQELRPVSAKLDIARHRGEPPEHVSRQALLHLVELASQVVEVEPRLASQARREKRIRVRGKRSRIGLLTSLRKSVESLFANKVGATTSSSPPSVRHGPRAVDTFHTRDSSKRSATAIIPTPVALPVSVAPTLPPDLATLTVIERGVLVRTTQKLLYITEFVVLVEYVEVIMPFTYNILVSILVSQPNHQYYPFLKNLNHQDLLPTMTNVMLYASLEFLSLLLLAAVLWWKLRFSILHQLAFVLERRQSSVQSKLVVWVIYVMQCSIDHFGADYSFRFEWLRHKS